MRHLRHIGRMLVLAAFSFALCTAGSNASAALMPAILQDANDPVNDNNPSVDNTLGYEFQIGSRDLTVTALGTWDGDDTSGLQASHPVGIYAIGGTLLGSVIVPSGTGAPKIGEYRYADLASPLTLLANTKYRIGSYVFGDFNHGSLFDDFGTAGDNIDPDWPVYATPDVTFVQRAGNLNTGGLVYPSALIQAGVSGWDAPNFLFVIPEPATTSGLALAAAALLRRRRAAVAV